MGYIHFFIHYLKFKKVIIKDNPFITNNKDLKENFLTLSNKIFNFLVKNAHDIKRYPLV